MVNGALQVVGFSFALIGWVLSIVTTFLPTWRKSDLQGEVIEAVRRNNGLWTRCQTQATGYWTCDDYDNFFLGLPTSLQGARACACISIALGFIATLICSLGLECTSVASENPRLKIRMVMVSGVLHCLGGIMIGAAVSWFAANILQDYNNLAVSQDNKFVYGEALFVGWGSMAVSCVSGFLLFCSSWNSNDDHNGPMYSYNNPKPKPVGREYI